MSPPLCIREGIKGWVIEGQRKGTTVEDLVANWHSGTKRQSKRHRDKVRHSGIEAKNLTVAE
jgi:hypothetical protein